MTKGLLDTCQHLSDDTSPLVTVWFWVHAIFVSMLWVMLYVWPQCPVCPCLICANDQYSDVYMTVSLQYRVIAYVCKIKLSPAGSKPLPCLASMRDSAHRSVCMCVHVLMCVCLFACVYLPAARPWHHQEKQRRGAAATMKPNIHVFVRVCVRVCEYKGNTHGKYTKQN